MKEIILKIIREYSINAKNYDVTILREDLDNMSDDMVREITRHLDKEVSPQDLAVCNYSGLRPVEGYKEEEKDKEDIDKEMKIERGDIDFMYKWIRSKSGK